MNDNKKFSIRDRARSFRFAFQGIATLLRDEHNARIHLVATVVVITAASFIGLSVSEWCAIIICIGLVFAAEAFNSAIEAIADKVSPEFSPLVKKAKDVAAAAVLILAIASVAVAAVIIGGKLL